MTRNQNVSGGGGGGAYILDRSLVPRIRLLAQVCCERAEGASGKRGPGAWPFVVCSRQKANAAG